MVANVDDCWNVASDVGAPVVVPIGDRYYGLRDFTIADPDGFGIRFATLLDTPWIGEGTAGSEHTARRPGRSGLRRSCLNPELEARLVELVRSTAWMMRILEAARAVDPPDWLVSAGAIRNLVWDHLHGFSKPTPLKDVDLGFFDANRLDEGRDVEVGHALRQLAPEVPWDAKNQAAVHLWYPQVFGVQVEPLSSCADAIGTFPETATSVGLGLAEDDRIPIAASLGLEDLFGLVCRRNPRRASVSEYRHRVRTKRIAELWPKVTILE
jgi:hypothetical protein